MADFATPEDLATYLQVPTVDTASANLLLASASAVIRGYVGWHVYPSRSETVTLDGPGTQYLMLPTLYLTAVATVAVKGVSWVFDTNYQWSEAGIIWTRSTWGGDYRSCVVAFTHGYAAIPDELKAVCLAMVGRGISSPSGVTREQAGGLSVSYSTGSGGQAMGLNLLDMEKTVLDRYRIVW